MTTPGLLLSNAAESLRQAIIEKPNLAADVGTITGLLSAIAPDIDTYVSDRLHWGEQIKQILARAGTMLSDVGEIEAALAFQLVEPASFSAANVEAYLDRLKITLTGVHARLESADEGSGAAALLDDIWSFLDQYTSQVSRHVPSLL